MEVFWLATLKFHWVQFTPECLSQVSFPHIFYLTKPCNHRKIWKKKRTNWVIFLKQLFCHDTAFILKQNAIIFKIYLYFVKFCQGGTLNMHNFSWKMQTLFFVTWPYAHLNGQQHSRFSKMISQKWRLNSENRVLSIHLILTFHTVHKHHRHYWIKHTENFT